MELRLQEIFPVPVLTTRRGTCVTGEYPTLTVPKSIGSTVALYVGAATAPIFTVTSFEYPPLSFTLTVISVASLTLLRFGLTYILLKSDSVEIIPTPFLFPSAALTTEKVYSPLPPLAESAIEE